MIRPGNEGMVLKKGGFPVYVKGGKGLDKTVGSHVLFERGRRGRRAKFVGILFSLRGAKRTPRKIRGSPVWFEGGEAGA